MANEPYYPHDPRWEKPKTEAEMMQENESMHPGMAEMHEEFKGKFPFYERNDDYFSFELRVGANQNSFYSIEAFSRTITPVHKGEYLEDLAISFEGYESLMLWIDEYKLSVEARISKNSD